MEAFKLFTVNEQSFEPGVDLSRYSSSASDKLCSLGAIAAYPLYPRKEFSAQAETMLPYSLSYVTQAPEKSTISKQGIILQVDSSQWLPLDADKDASFLLDVSDKYLLLYCPVGGTFLRTANKRKAFLLQVS